MSLMRIPAVLATALVLAVCAAPVYADGQPAATPAKTEAPAKADKAKQEEDKRAAELKEVVCKNTPVLGSRIPKRTCRTRADWIALREHSREQTQGFQDSNSHYNRVEGQTGGG